MAPIIYLILQVFLRLRLVSSVDITLTAPINPVEAGNMLSIHCQVHQLKVGKQVVEIRRNVTGTNVRVSLDDKMMVDDADERFFLAQRRLHDNSVVYFLSIIEITRETDEGVYTCIIRDQDTLAELTRKSVTVLFKYFPEDIYPVCYPPDYSGEIEMKAGQRMTINCTSELGNPDIEIEWTKNDVPFDNAIKSTDNGHSILELTFTTSSDDNGDIYVCKITSVAFPDEERSCHVGPFKISPDPKATKRPSLDTGNTNNKMAQSPGQTTIAPKVGKSSNNKNGPTYITTECSEVCDENILYWIIATIIAGTLAIAFCIIGIIIFVRYRRRRKEENKKRETSRNSHYQNREAIYAEVDTRPPEGSGAGGGQSGGDPNDNKLYMALDKSSYISTIDTSRAAVVVSVPQSPPGSPISHESEPLNSPTITVSPQTVSPQTLEDPYSTRNVTHTTFGL